MLQPDQRTTALISALLTRYGFELADINLLRLINDWLKLYSVYWIRLAIVEALYQGRYKAISVEHILSLWRRKGQPTFHFSHDFERLICRNLAPFYLPSESSWRSATAQLTDTQGVKGVSSLIAAVENSVASNRNGKATSVVSDSSISVWDERNFLTQPSPEDSLDQSPNNAQESAFLSVGSERSIHQFTPLLDRSRLYSKLRAAVHQGWAETTSD